MRNQNSESFKSSLKSIKLMMLIIFLMLLFLIFMNLGEIENVYDPPQELMVQKELPKIVNENDIINLLEDVQRTINMRDAGRLYDLLGDYAQTRMRVHDIELRMNDVKYYGNMVKVAYSHYKYIGNKNGSDWFTLECLARFDNGSGTLNLVIRVTNEHWELASLYIDMEELEQMY